MIEWLATMAGRHLRVRGIGRLLGALYPCRHDSARFINGIRTRSDGLRMALDTRTLIDWEVRFHGRYEPHLCTLFEKTLSVSGVAVDVGANVGAHTLTLARLVGPSGTVLAFEPNPAILARLQKNVGLNSLNQVAIFDCALGATAARMDLRVPSAERDEAANPGMASLVALDTPHDLVSVDVRPFDDIAAELKLERMDLVKIDVQGYECQTLQGMFASMGRFRPIIVFEYEDWAWRQAGSSIADAVLFFQDNDYRLFRIHRDGTCIPLNTAEAEPEMTHADILAAHVQDARVASLVRATGA